MSQNGFGLFKPQKPQPKKQPAPKPQRKACGGCGDYHPVEDFRDGGMCPNCWDRVLHMHRNM